MKKGITIAIYLFLCLLGAALLSGLTGWFYYLFPTSSSEGSAWGAIDDAFSVLTLTYFYFIAAIIAWLLIAIVTLRKSVSDTPGSE